MFGVCPEVNPKISYAGTAAYMLHVKQLPDISQSFWLLDAGTFPLWSRNTFWRGDYQRVLNVSHETNHRHLMFGFERVQISEAIDAESRTYRDAITILFAESRSSCVSAVTLVVICPLKEIRCFT